MATAVTIPVSEYLRTSYEPDAEYVDGHVEERTMGEYDHADLQGMLIELLRSGEKKSYFKAIPEWRVQVATDRFRVPDIALRRVGAPKERIARTAPLLCIEILSPEDTMRRMLARVRDFLEMGVPEVWVFDPETRTVYVCSGNSMVEYLGGELTVPDTPVRISVAEVFSVLDED